jgi:hypothetical protein
VIKENETFPEVVPDWRTVARLEVQGVKSVGGDVETTDTPEFFSVYARQHNGQVICLGDFLTQSEAVVYVIGLGQKHIRGTV